VKQIFGEEIGMKTALSIAAMILLAAGFASSAPGPTSPDPKGEQPRKDTTKPSAQPQARTFTCPMHPEVAQKEPGRCPKCGMTLELKK
jgi:Cu+-exporting ATPase